jgi:hypothetical protein
VTRFSPRLNESITLLREVDQEGWAVGFKERMDAIVVEERGPTIEAAEQFLDDVGSRIVEECQTEGCLLDPGHEGEHRVVEKR